MKKRILERKKAVNFSGAFLISLLLITSMFAVGIPTSFADSEPFPPKTIYGFVYYCNGGVANGASVVVSASGYPDETDTTDSSGYYSVDIGSDTGTEWPDGTSFTVTATLGSWSGSNTGTVSGSLTQCDVTMDPPTLVADASATPTTIVAGESVDFTGSATGGATPYSWFWDFDGDGTSTEQNPTHTFNSQGSYDCVLEVTDGCGNTDTDTVTITVNPSLSCDAGGPYTGDICDPVQFDGSASGGHGGNSFSWTFGDGNSGSGEDPSHQYTSDGTYTATLTVTDSEGDTASDTAPVSISTSDVTADAGGPYSGSTCDPIQFSGSASGGCTPYTWSWDFGDGGSGSGQFPTHQYSNDGTYTVTLTVTSANGDSDQDTATVSINTDPVTADAGGPYSEIVGNPIDFIGSASGGCEPYDWFWEFGDGSTSTDQNPTHTYSEEGVFTVVLTVTDDAGTVESDQTTATIDSAEVIANAGGPYYGEVGEIIEFSGSASDGTSPYTYLWDFGDGSTGTGPNPVHAYDAPNDDEGYDVVLTVTDSNGFSDWDGTKAFVSGDAEEVTANAHGPYSGVIGEEIIFSGSAFGGSEPYSYEWDFGDGNTSTEQNPVHTYGSLGTFDVTLTVMDDTGDTDMDTTTATVEEEPVVPDLVCRGFLSWSDVDSGGEVSNTFVVANEGDPGSLLDWEIISYPDWGTWTFTPSSGSDLTPADGDVEVTVSVVAPTAFSVSRFVDADEEYSGQVVVMNSEDSNDQCVIDVTMTVPHVINPWMWLWNMLCERFPLLELVYGSLFV